MRKLLTTDLITYALLFAFILPVLAQEQLREEGRDEYVPSGYDSVVTVLASLSGMEQEPGDFAISPDKAGHHQLILEFDHFKEVECRLFRTDDGFLLLDNNNSKLDHAALAELNRIVILGNAHKAKGALIGGVIGAGLGLVTMLTDNSDSRGHFRIHLIPDDDPTASAVVFGLLGSGIGTFLGAGRSMKFIRTKRLSVEQKKAAFMQLAAGLEYGK